jgi:predicted branched-subunit amino acid permease
MKIQDILFIVLLVVLLLKRKENSFVAIGLGCFLLAIPFFYLYVFFTAERLLYYGALLVFIEVIFKLIQFGIKPRK